MKPRPVARLLMAAVRGYRLMLSPWLGASCRFEPTCSRYALTALELLGAPRLRHLFRLAPGDWASALV